jgi:hypothetical protein
MGFNYAISCIYDIDSIRGSAFRVRLLVARCQTPFLSVRSTQFSLAGAFGESESRAPMYNLRQVFDVTRLSATANCGWQRIQQKVERRI